MRQKPTTYKPTGLARPTSGEIRNGFTAETLTAYLKNACDTEYELKAELYRRAKDHERIALAAIAKFKKLEDPDLPENQERLAALEREAAEASADAACGALCGSRRSGGMIESETIDRARHLVRYEGLGVAEAARELKVNPKKLAAYVSALKEPWPAKDVQDWHRARAGQQDPRDVTGRVLGDPPPGRSALDQRRHHAP